ncbi:unnamed protein product [Paramecium primaurelia]|uniref:Uncharacterized protein n=1 Tax=Paramecium primaurelia TaxID=5886 RepID=A0A8S1Q9N9_PARPR|nr:unnamed protein product [Paramecium primaurelia]
MRCYYSLYDLSSIFTIVLMRKNNTLSNPIREYYLNEYEMDNQYNPYTYIQMNEIKQCQLSRQIQLMICYQELGDNETNLIYLGRLQSCNLYKIRIFSSEFLIVTINLYITQFSWYIVSKEKDEIEKQHVYKILRNRIKRLYYYK